MRCTTLSRFRSLGSLSLTWGHKCAVVTAESTPGRASKHSSHDLQLTHFRSLISSNAVSVNIWALLTTFRATKHLSLHETVALVICVTSRSTRSLWARSRKRYLRHIPAEPHSGEMTPSQLSHHLVPVHKNLSNFHTVITTCNVRIPQTRTKPTRKLLLKIKYVNANRA